jgi:hypothetical protein
MEGSKNEASKYASSSPFRNKGMRSLLELRRKGFKSSQRILDTTPPFIAKRRKVGLSQSRLSVQWPGLIDFKDFRPCRLLELLQPERFLK